jgi:hypothetical protein
LKPLTSAEILAAFPMHERRAVRPPAAASWADLDFLSWLHRSGHLGFIVIERSSGLLGLTLERNVIRTHRARRFMCDLCCTIHSEGGVADFTRWNRRRTIARTVTLCADLACAAYIKGARRNFCVQMAETLTRDEKIGRMMANLNRLAAHWTFPAPGS